MSYTVQKILSIRQALSSLIALENERPFKLSGKTRLALVQNVRVAANAAAAFGEARDAMIKRLGVANDKGGFEVKPDTPEHKELVAAIDDMLKQPADLGGCSFVVIPFDALADENATPIGLLSDLLDLGILSMPDDAKPKGSKPKKGAA